MKVKPKENQDVFVLFRDALYKGIVIYVTDTPKAEYFKYIFDVVTEPIYFPDYFDRRNPRAGSFRQRHFRCSSFHVEPKIEDGMWTMGGFFSPCFIFYSKESYERRKNAIKESEMRYHVGMAELIRQGIR